MGLWIKTIIGRWRKQHIRTKTSGQIYRAFERNLAALDNGEAVWGEL